MAIETHTHSQDVEKAITGLSVPIFTEKGFALREKPLINANDTYPDMPQVSAIYTSNLEGINTIKSNPEMQLIRAPDIRGMLIACPSFVEINKKPVKHVGSKAKYLAEMKVRSDMFFLSTLGPNQWTSKLHFHADDIPDDLKLEMSEDPGPAPEIEYYNIVYGMAIIHHEEGDKGYVVPKFFSVEPGVRHRMEAGPKGAILAIDMKNAAIYPPELRHIHY